MARQLELRDFLRYKYLSSPKFSPDGKHVAFVVSQANKEESGYESRIYLWNGKVVKQLTDLGKEQGFFWEDATHILFPAARSAEDKKRAEAGEAFTHYYRLDITGGEAISAFELPFAAGGMKRIQGSLYAVSGSIEVEKPDNYLLSQEERAKAAQADKEEADYEVLEEIPFYHNGGTYSSRRRDALFVYDAENGAVHRVTSPTFQVDDFVALNGRVYIIGGPYTQRMPLVNGLYVYTPGEDEARCICENNEATVQGLIAVEDTLIALASKCDRYGLNVNPYVYAVDTETGALTLIRAEEYSMYNSTGSDCRLGGGEALQMRGGEIFFTGTREGNAPLMALNLKGEVRTVLGKEGSADAFAVSDGAEYAFVIGMYDNRLQEAYTCDLATGELQRITHMNDAVLEDVYVADYQPLTVNSEGLDISGWVLLPKDYDPEQKYPAILDIHGGPKTVYGPIFFHEMQVWANMGYFVFFCNPKGGDGRDNEFADIRGAYGETDYVNLMDFTDAVLKAYPAIDPKRLCVTGGSYGGFMTNWIIGHTDRFCCAATQRSISNWLGFYGTSDIGYFFAMDQCGGTPYEQPEKLWEHSPLKYAMNVKTPTLFIHSDQDYRCPLPEGLQLFTALCERGVPARMCLFHGENHELSRSGVPKHRVRRLQEITSWFEKYAK